MDTPTADRRLAATAVDRSPTLDDLVTTEGFLAADRLISALTARLTGGLSPAALMLACADWAVHLAASPGKRAELGLKAQTKAARLLGQTLLSLLDPAAAPCIEPLPGDRRFRAEAWQRLPFRLWYQGFLLTQQWWHNATHEVPGVSPHHEDVVSFVARQLLDVMAPANLWFGNPEVLERTVATGGTNIAMGFCNLAEDIARKMNRQPPVGSERFAVGEDVAVTPGSVVYRNRLVELIQYAPLTTTVAAEPVLIIPAWIMKYYILDLSPQNSLIRHLVAQGHTVFCVSWRNVTAEDRDLGLDDYRRLGVTAALDAIAAIMPGRRVHGVGYCLGGTLLSIAAAAEARAAEQRLATMTLLAAQTDFSAPGELALFIDHSQVHLLKSMMWDRGYLDAAQMAGAFQMLRSNDLIWSQMLHSYLMGERAQTTDLMAWNADATRLPYRMHSEYLQGLFLDNDLAAGRHMVDGHPIALQNIGLPVFVVGTEHDHVAPWTSVYKIHYLTDTDVTFLLTSGGHNAGIVSPPDQPGRRFRMLETQARHKCLSAEEWEATAPVTAGSWWPAWQAWLRGRSAVDALPPPAMGAPAAGYPPLCPAPGTFVLQR